MFEVDISKWKLNIPLNTLAVWKSGAIADGIF